MAVIRAYEEGSYVNKKGEAPVYVSFYIAREKIVISVNVVGFFGKVCYFFVENVAASKKMRIFAENIGSGYSVPD